VRAWLDNGVLSIIVMMIGAILGQILFGSLADIYGRGRSILCAISGLQCVAFAAAACCRPVDDLQGVFVPCLFLLGLGSGAEYPVAASQIVETMSKQAPHGTLRTLGGAFLYMGLGQVLAPLILISCISWNLHDENVWSVAFAVGALLSVTSFGLRWRYAEETSFFLEQRRHSNCDVHASGENDDRSSSSGLALLCQHLEPLSRLLMGTCVAAFLFNVLTGGMLLHRELAMTIFLKTSGDKAVEETFAVFVAACLSFPGYMMAPIVARQKRRRWQLGGFLATAIGLGSLSR
jgi:MFS family permease